MLVEVDADSGEVVATEPIAGVPDVVFFNSGARPLYVAIGDPGVIEVFDTAPLRRHETVTTEAGAHTLSFDASAQHRLRVPAGEPPRRRVQGSRVTGGGEQLRLSGRGRKRQLAQGLRAALDQTNSQR